MAKKRLVYPDLLRVIAGFMVILGHVTSNGIRGYNMNTSVWTASIIINSLCHWSVPAFFMVSGMFFLDPQKEVDTKNLYTKSIWRIVRCIVVWGFAYGLLDQYLYSTLTLKSVFITLYGVVTGHTGYHLWFLYTLLMLYVAVPVLKVFTKHATKQQLDYALVVWFVFGIVIGQINAAAEAVLSTENWLPYEPLVLTRYAGYFLLGYRLKAYTLPKKTYRLLYLLSVISAVAIPLGNMRLPQSGIISALSGISDCLIATTVFVFVSRLNTEKWSDKVKVTLAFLGERMFGIYLVHVFFVSLIFHVFSCKFGVVAPVLQILITGLIIWWISLAVSWCFAKIKGLKTIV